MNSGPTAAAAEGPEGQRKKKSKKSKKKHEDKIITMPTITTAPSSAPAATAVSNAKIAATPAPAPAPARPAAAVSSARPAGAAPTTGSGQWNFAAEYNDHFETPPGAYADIASALGLLAEELGKSKEDLVIYDPYYCKGSMVSHMESLGFKNVLNFNRDFYNDIVTKAVPDFDILVTNPPYSGEHKQKLLTYLSNRYDMACIYFNELACIL
jgi:hypothetical protein